MVYIDNKKASSSHQRASQSTYRIVVMVVELASRMTLDSVTSNSFFLLVGPSSCTLNKYLIPPTVQQGRYCTVCTSLLPTDSFSNFLGFHSSARGYHDFTQHQFVKVTTRDLHHRNSVCRMSKNLAQTSVICEGIIQATGILTGIPFTFLLSVES